MSDTGGAMRLDRRLVEIGAFATRTRAQAAVRAGLVRVDGVMAMKPSQMVGAEARLSVEGEVHPYVSRGGVKLAAALEAFAVDPRGKICLDLGASTGGFTDVLLRRGAAKVYAVDVGSGQLHSKISSDRRVVSLEKTHAKDLSRGLIPEAIDLVVCDVSFISLKKALPPALALCGAPALERRAKKWNPVFRMTGATTKDSIASGDPALSPDAIVVALIKPQFELGPDKIGKGGLVRASDEEMRALVGEIRQWFEDRGWRVIGATDSPILGGDGNREFLIAASR